MSNGLNRPALFVISLPRSGSTLLRLILDTHPDISCPDELSLGRLVSALYTTFAGLHETTDRTFQSLKPSADDPILPDIRQVVDGMMGAFAARKGKRIWCDKTPSNVDFADLLAGAFPDARFLMLHRHCFDFVSSCIRFTAYSQPMPMLDAALRRHYPNHTLGFIDAWEERTADMLRFEREMGERAHRLRYEDLVRDPRTTLSALFSFLGVGFDPALIDKVFVTEHRQRPNGGDWRAYMSTKISDESIGAGSKLPWSAIQPTPLAVRERVNLRLEQLGYPRIEFREDGFSTGFEKPAQERFTPATLFDEVLPLTLEGISDVPEALSRAWVFAIGGDNGGTWTVDLGERPPTIEAGSGEGIEVRIASSDLEAVMNGHQPPAYLLGRVHVGGGLPPEVGGELLRLLFAA